jgi:hypothetical protein
MVEATALNIMDLRSSSILSHPHKFHQNPPIGSRVIKRILCTNLRSLNVHHFGIVEATILKK